MSPKQEPKYNASVDGRIVNRATGEPIPDDEPVFIFRARDVYAVNTLRCYLGLITDRTPAMHQLVVSKRISDFEAFAKLHPERMKTPDTDPQP